MSVFNKISGNMSRGFNLVEAAIVLGVVGLIIGGIWIAASAVSEEHLVNRINTVFTTTVSNIDQMTDLRQDLTGATTETLIAAGVFPAGSSPITISVTSLAQVSTIPGYFVYVAGPSLVWAYGPPPWVAASPRMPTSVCIKLVTRLYGVLRQRSGSWTIVPFTGGIPAPSASNSLALNNTALATKCALGAMYIRLVF